MTIRERKHGPDHPDTARTRGELALVSQAQGQAEKATTYYEQALATLNQRLGPHHPDTQRIAGYYQTWQTGLQKKRRGKKGEGGWRRIGEEPSGLPVLRGLAVLY